MSAQAELGTAATVARTVDGVPIRNLWHMLLYAWGKERFLERWRADAESAPSMEALLAGILSSLVRQQLRVGLGRGYVSTREELRGIRGRVDFSRSLNRLTFENGRAVCGFDEFQANVLRNQVVRSTLARLVQRGSFGAASDRADALRHELRSRVRDLDGIDLVQLQAHSIRRARAERNDGAYDLMLAICELLHRCWMPSEQGGAVRTPRMDRASQVLPRIFEDFVANFFKVRLRGWTVRSQGRLSWHEDKTSVYLPGMIADVILRRHSDDSLLVLDTKFAGATLAQGRFDSLSFKTSHLYQMYAYLRSQDDVSAAHRSAAGVLLYPAVDLDLAEEVQLQGHSIRFTTLDLDQPWEQVEEDLLAIAG